MGTQDDFFEATTTDPTKTPFEASGSSFWAITNSVVGGGPQNWAWGGYLIGSQYGVHGQAFISDAEADWPPSDSYSENAGVIGTSPDFPGLAGLSAFMPGVYGHQGLAGEVWVDFPNGLAAGVLGTSHNWSGVIGYSTNWHGVEAFTIYGEAAVVADAQNGLGVWAYSSTLSGVNGIAAAAGPLVPDNSNIAGVVGTSDAQHGVIGTSNTGVGIIGFSNSVAGQFIGDLQVTGTKAAVVSFPDGTHRALYCMESPDLWFEDFGEAKLARGRAVVKLDPNFAKVIRTGDYRVFLTPEGDCRGLYVRRKSAVRFEVRELMGGKSSIAFSYCIVGRRKDISRKRFAKIDMRLPQLTPPPRKPQSAASAHSFVARVEKEARQRGQKLKKQSRRARKLPNYVRLARGIGRPMRGRANSRSK